MSATLRGLGRRAFNFIAASGKPGTTLLAASLFSASILALGAAQAGAQITGSGGVTDLGSVNIGAAASTATITFSVATGHTATPSSVSAVALGDILQDFSIPAQTCVGTTLNGPATCTVTVAFAPTARGSRRGAVILTAPGQPNVVVYVHGSGVGSQLVFAPDTASSTGTVTPLQPNNYSPSTAVFDAAGNLYFNDILNGRILEQSASGTLATVVALPGTIMSSLALSGDGTIFATVPSQAAVYAIVPGIAPSKTLLNFTGVTLNRPSGIAVDADNSLYIADSATNNIIHSTAAGVASSLPLTSLAKPLSGPEGIALDGLGNLFIADTGNARIVEVNLASGVATPLTINGANLYNPYGLTTDASGTLYIADTGNRRIVRVLPSGMATAVLLSNLSFSSPTGVALAANGDIVVADNNSGLTRIFRTSPTPTITFATATDVGTFDSSDGPLNVTLQNIGNAPLQITLPTQANANPKISTTAFSLSSTSTCPLPVPSTPAAAAQIAAGTACTYAVTFMPTAAGTNTASLNIVTRPTGATGNVTSAVTLTGTGISVTTPPGSADNFVITAPVTATVGTPISFTVTAFANGAATTTYTGTVTLTTNDGKAIFGGGSTYTFTAADMGTHTFTAPAAGLTFGTAGTFQITASSGGVVGISNNILVSASPTAANTIAFTITPTATVGIADAFTLTVSANGAPNPAYRGTVTFTSTDPLATFPGGTTYTFTAADAGTHSFPQGVVFGTAGTFTVTATDGTAMAMATVIVSAVATPPPPPNTLAFTITPTATIGVADAFTLTVTANGAVNTGYRGTVTFTSTDPLATFPGGTTYTFTAADAGAHTFFAGVVFGTVGTFAVKATDNTTPTPVTATTNVIVTAAVTPPVPNTLAFTISPTATVGVADAFTLTVTANGAVNPAYRGTVTFNATDPLATFPGGLTYTFTAADAGVHTFPAGVVFGTVGTFTVSASDGTAFANANVVVSAATTPPPPSTLSFIITPTATVGVGDAFTLTATANGAPNPAYRGTVTLTSTDPLATFPAGTVYTFTAADAGTHTFPVGVVFGTAGTFTVNATDGVANAAATVVVSAPVVTPNNTIAFTITPTATIGVADAFTLSVTQNGAAATGYRGTVTLSSTDPLATFPGGTVYTFTAADAGTHTFATGVVFGSAGTFAVNATDGVANATANVVVSPKGTTPPPPVVNTFAIITTPTATVGVGDSFTLNVTQNGVAATGYLGTVTLSSTDPLATFPGGTVYTFTAADAGTHTFTPGILFGTVGTFTIHATDGTAAATANVIVSAAGTPPPPTLITPTIALTTSVNPVAIGGTTTLTATVIGTVAGGAPTGTIGFYDGGVLLSAINTTTGTATLTATFATAGTHNLTAIYSGSAVYNPVTSTIVAETVGDLQLTLTPNTPGTVTVFPANTGTFSFTVTPAGTATFVLPVTLSATGAPKGSTITFTPTQIAAGSGATTFTLSIAVPAATAALHGAPVTPSTRPGTFTGIAPIAFALALLPLLSRRRRKLLLPTLAMLGLTFGALGTTGCIADQASGYFGQTPVSYSIVVTATNGATTRSTTVTLIVQ